MTFDEAMIYLGVKIPDLIAGSLGGVVKALMVQREQPIETIVSGIAGGLTANYLGEMVADKIGMGRGAACFVVGLTAMLICQSIINRVRNWSKKDNGNA